MGSSRKSGSTIPGMKLPKMVPRISNLSRVCFTSDQWYLWIWMIDLRKSVEQKLCELLGVKGHISIPLRAKGQVKNIYMSDSRLTLRGRAFFTTDQRKAFILGENFPDQMSFIHWKSSA
ncbi:hypothetical protein DY000_02048611 [Brassica cretica]|uniref:Uncharacterized protein n=1 Tax=Brassica cretica TaxID=69181 RepID=A0ABQ7F8A7_BRACR|nr:hypothetical protein DY000_02048611 [Brassica cretica]